MYIYGLLVKWRRKLQDHVWGMLLNREDRETEMTYGDGIWLIGFVLLPNGEANHAEGEALNKRCRRDTEYEKCVSR